MSEASENPAAVPTEIIDVQGDARWQSMHEDFCHQSREKEANVIFIGDSLVQLMAHVGDWDRQVAPLHCLNFGIGGDRTEHVLWRVVNGELDNINAKVVVIWCGTNNHGNTAPQIAEGIMAIADQVSLKQPESTIIILSLLPRGKNPNPLRDRNKQVNEIVQESVKHRPAVQYFDVSDGFVSSDGTISTSDMYDFLHLTRHGYEKIVVPLVDELKGILGD